MTASGRTQSRSLRRLWMVAGATAALLLTASCSGSDDDPDVAVEPDRTSNTRPERTTTSGSTASNASTTASTTTARGDQPVTPAEKEIIDRYVAFWEVRFAANTGTPDPADEALAEYATAAQLEAVIAETQANLDQGLAFQARPNPANFRRVTIVSVTGDQAVVQECFVDDGLVIRRETGDIVNDTIATQSVRGELQRVDNEWRVSSSRLVQRWEGVDGCALAS